MARRDATQYSCIITRTVVPSVGSRDFLVAVYGRCEFHYEVKLGDTSKEGHREQGTLEGEIVCNIAIECVFIHASSKHIKLRWQKKPVIPP